MPRDFRSSSRTTSNQGSVPRHMTSHPVRKALLFIVALMCLQLSHPRATAQDPPNAVDRQQTAPAQNQPSHATALDQPAVPDTQHHVRHIPTLDEQLKTFTDRLNLDRTQQGMVKIILERRQSELFDVYKNQSLSAVDRFNAVKAVHERAYDGIGHLLNPEQSKKFELIRPHATPLPLPDSEKITPPRHPTN